MASVEIFIVMDSDGDHAIGADEDAAWEAFENDVGGSGARRCVRVEVQMEPPPAVEDGGSVSVGESAGHEWKMTGTAE